MMQNLVVYFPQKFAIWAVIISSPCSISWDGLKIGASTIGKVTHLCVWLLMLAGGWNFKIVARTPTCDLFTWSGLPHNMAAETQCNYINLANPWSTSCLCQALGWMQCHMNSQTEHPYLNIGQKSCPLSLLNFYIYLWFTQILKISTLLKKKYSEKN